MTSYGVLLENPRRRRRRRTPPRGAGGRFRKRGSTKRRRRNPTPRRRTRRRATARRRPAARRRRPATRRRRRRNVAGLLPSRGAVQTTLRRGTQILVGDVAGDALARVANKFGLQRLLTQMRVPANMQVPVTRILVGLFGPRLLKMLPGRIATADFRATFGAINVAQALMELTRNMRTQALQSVGLADYEYAYPVPPGMGDYELSGLGQSRGMLEDTPYGMLSDYEYESGAMNYY